MKQQRTGGISQQNNLTPIPFLFHSHGQLRLRIELNDPSVQHLAALDDSREDLAGRRGARFEFRERDVKIFALVVFPMARLRTIQIKDNESGPLILKAKADLALCVQT